MCVEMFLKNANELSGRDLWPRSSLKTISSAICKIFCLFGQCRLQFISVKRIRSHFSEFPVNVGFHKVYGFFSRMSEGTHHDGRVHLYFFREYFNAYEGSQGLSSMKTPSVICKILYYIMCFLLLLLSGDVQYCVLIS